MVMVCAAGAPSKEDAQKALYAARWAEAAEMYRQILAVEPGWGPGWDALVRALLEAYETPEAYAAADEALKNAPDSAGALTASGRVLYRRGEMPKAEGAFNDALRRDPHCAAALEGLARIYALLARYRMAEHFALAAYRAQPDDPELMIAYANSLRGAEHISALERALAIFDPTTREAHALEAHIAADKALGDRKVRVQTTPYQEYEFKLMELLSDPRHSSGAGLRVRFNDRYTGTLLLDTGASGIALSPKAAQKAGMEQLEQAGSETYGMGDAKARESYGYLAREVRVGDLAWSNYPVHVFDTARDPDRDGIIGPDVFARFLTELDFPRMTMRLIPRAVGPPGENGPQDSANPPAGFHNIYRLGHMLLIPVFVNDGPRRLFLLDSGASQNVIDTDTAAAETKVYGDSTVEVRGVQGKVEKVSRADHIRLTFAGMRQENPGLLAVSLRRMSDHTGIEESGILGMPVLRQLKVTIDYADAAVKLDYERK